MTTFSLEFDSLSKFFPGVRALDGVSFGVRHGSVHALCGENGAGKSTLLKILSGAYQPDAGSLMIEGKSVQFANPFAAFESGAAVIYQELHLVPQLTVAENILLGHFPSQAGWVKRDEVLGTAKQLLTSLSIDIDPNALVGSLSIAQCQMVEIAKALSRNAKVIAFDEPTSSLSSREVETLFGLIRTLKSEGKSILYVTHRMDEIFDICDSATVLRDGWHVETMQSLDGVSPEMLIKLMVGREISDIYGYRARPVGEPRLEVKELMAVGLKSPASLQVRVGEIVGVFGLVGAGRSELLHAIYGATHVESGSVAIDQYKIAGRNPQGSIRLGMSLCPEDRKQQGIVPKRSVSENVNISRLRNLSRFGFWLNTGLDRATARSFVERLDVKTPSLEQPIQLLSGGNQQKVILGRWLDRAIKVMMLDEPTRGIDVGAKREIYETIYSLAESGVAILMVSSDLSEVLGVSDRILVMNQGHIVGELDRSEATQERIMQLALQTNEAA